MPIFLYKVRFEDGTEANIISDMNGITGTSRRVQSVYAQRLQSIRHLGTVRVVNEYDGDPMKNLKAEIKHHIKRIEEEVGTYQNGRNRDILNETDAIRELIR